MKHDVITAKLTTHIPVDRNDRESVDNAYEIADRMCDDASLVGQATMETRLNRVTVPEPTTPELESGPVVPETPDAEPLDNGLDIPENLCRTSEPAAAE